MIGELTNHLWQSTLFAVAAGLLAFGFRKNRAQIRYWLWLSASLKFMVPFALLMSLGSHLGWAPAAKTVATQAASMTMVQIAQPFPDTSARIQITSPLPGPTRFVPAAPRSANWLLIAILGVWACGLIVIASIRLKLWLRIRDAVCASTPLEIPAIVDVRSSPGLLEPGVVGLFQPVLLLPEGIIERLTPSQLEAVLAHESCHVRRRDNLTAALHMIVEGVFWFHPVVWWISAELVKERERACDEDVLRLGSQPQVYAEGILSICKFYVDSPLACVSGVTGADLKKRVKLIMRNHVGDPLNTWGKLFLAAAGVLALALPVVFGLLNATPSHAQSQAENNSAGVKASFESAGIKLDKSPSPKLHSQIYFPNRFIATSTARWLIEYAYSSRKETCDLAVAICNDEERGYPIFDDQIVGGPDWIKSEMFDVDAKVGDTVAQSDEKWPDQVRPMLQSLLAERFQLRIRRERMDRPAYALVVAKGGPKFPEDNSHPERGGVRALGQGKFQLTSEPLGRLTWLLSMRPSLGRRLVLDKTGLPGRYSFDVQLAEESEASPELSESSVSKALEEQLGLKLEPTTTPMDTIIIEHIEQPSEN